jgi:LysM repeat protein
MMDKKQLPMEEQSLAKNLEALAQSLEPDPIFERNLERRLIKAHSPEPQAKTWIEHWLPTLGWVLGVVLLALALNWFIRSLAPEPQPATSGTGTPASTQAVPPPERPSQTPLPSSQAYDWNGVTLYLDAKLPDGLGEAYVFITQPDLPATIQSALAMAQRWGIDGQVYEVPGELPDTSGFMVTDGMQRLYLRSANFFTYYADYSKLDLGFQGIDDIRASGIIDAFLKSHGFEFTYRLEPARQIQGQYYVVPFTSDGLPIRYDYNLPARLEFTLNDSGRIVSVNSNHPTYTAVGGNFRIIGAQEAFQQVLSGKGTGVQSTLRSGGKLNERVWQRQYPTDQPLSLYGRATSYPALEEGIPPFVAIGNFTTTGNLAGLDALPANTIVEATGQFQIEGNIRRFVLDSWRISEAYEISLVGTLQHAGNKVILQADDGTAIELPDAPSDLPFDILTPDQPLTVSGFSVGGNLVWNLIQYFPPGSSSGGSGGGGGGTGLYKLNLTGTPIPFPPAAIASQTSIDSNTYIVQAGDTLTKIASDFGVSLDALLQANDIGDPSTIYVGQELTIPDLIQNEPQKVEGLRGNLNIVIYKQADGSQRAEYRLVADQPPHPFLILQGENLEVLQAYQNRPIDVWGTLSPNPDTPSILQVERYEIPFPDLQFQILRGTQETTTLEGKPATLFTTEDGQTYAQLSPIGEINDSMVGRQGDQILIEALVIPGETFGGYPGLRMYGASIAINPKNGQPADMQTTADRIPTYDEPSPSESQPPTATIEQVELVYYTHDPRYKLPDQSGEPSYIQPMWRFYGHYSTGDEFEILVQALQKEYLSPEVETIEPPG